jgi:hypothetical protein
MTPDDVRLIAVLVRDKRVHCVSDEAVRALALRVLELEGGSKVPDCAVEWLRRDYNMEERWTAVVRRGGMTWTLEVFPGEFGTLRFSWRIREWSQEGVNRTWVAGVLRDSVDEAMAAAEFSFREVTR